MNHNAAWKPNVTVAVIVEREERYLVVEEIDSATGTIVYNQPAGHVDEGEEIVAAAARECLEETAWTIRPHAFVGIYQWRHPTSGITYLRFCIAAEALAHDPARSLDEGIVRALWLTAPELQAQHARHRSPLVWQCVEDFRRGRRYPLALLQTLDSPRAHHQDSH